MFEKESIPFAPALVESMRSLGYSFEAAIADLIDNSISAQAKKIEIFVTASEQPYLIIMDDGYGMGNEELEKAMRYGSKNPLDIREDSDLGRFGMGLKAASLSQCRQLVVVSKQNGIVSCYSWNLDHVIETGQWLLLGYDSEEIEQLPKIENLYALESGTYILLQKFDRIAVSTNNISETLTKYMDNTIDHLSLVFHRFLCDGLSIYVNNREVEPRDPFLQSNKATQLKREQSFTINGSKITMKPYILPHISKLTEDEIRIVGGKASLRSGQGFYIYRNRRLIIWGTWFRLERKDELSKLARIRVDIPNSLDYMWGIDIKKSTANLPDIIKRNLYNCVYESILGSESVHSYRGRSVNSNKDIDYIWERIATREGYQYKINTDIPQAQVLMESLNTQQKQLLNILIRDIEKSFPSSTLYLDVSKGHLVEESENIDTQNNYEMIMQQIDVAKKMGMDVSLIINSFLKLEPYCTDKELIKLLCEELKKYE